MNHHQHIQPVPKKETASTVAASVSSIIFSILASSHHWLHMGILLILGSSTNMMVSMSGILWLRRVMVIASVITAMYSLYRLKKNIHMPIWMKAMTIVSIIITFGFILYTLITFGL